ncbi:MAG: carbohydrate kinase family protein [Chthoniobacterales bacterium]|nr:carbohydrate kinase family protein [Chthoniobacterales bacterium]
MSNSSLAAAAADFLSERAKALPHSPSLVGLDGFADTILHVVATRESTESYKRMSSMAEFGKRIGAAAGLSANFEMVPQMVKLGGNGPIMANALGAYGTPVTYVGVLGAPNIHPVFADFAERAKVISLAEPGYTDAIEFDDGKLMFGKHSSLREVNWENLLAHIPADKLVGLFRESALVALVNWTMLTGMTRIFEELLEKVMPQVGGEPWMFFDLADPAKRTREDIKKAIGLIAQFQTHAKVILGLNLQEARQIGEVLGFPPCEETHDAGAAHAALIRAKLGVETVVIHPVAFAAAADAQGTSAVQGPFIEKPKITTGAGDHFNAGFCIGRMLGAPLDVSLQIGVGTSGFYVRTAKSPSVADMTEFLRTL